MNILKYTAFVKAVEYGSFTKAGEILDYSQSAISKMIKDLESELKISLLERGKGGVRLTSEGKELLPYAKGLCEEYDRLKGKVEEIQGIESGIIRIGTFSSVATHWLPKIIKSFQKDYPNIEYELLLGDYTEIEEWIETGRVDCGFLRLPANGDFDTIFLKQDRLMAILPVNHPLADFDKVPLQELCTEPFLLLEKGAKAEISRVFERNNLKPNVRFTTWDDYAVMSMVENGLGISMLPELILKRIPYNILAKEVDVPAYRDIGLALRDRKKASLATKRFMEYIVNSI